MKQKDSVRLACVYQVVMHYRLPFYERLADDPRFEFCIFHGSGQPGTKLQNTELTGSVVRSELVEEFRLTGFLSGVSMPFSPLLVPRLWRWKPQVVLCEGASSLVNATQVFLFCKFSGVKFIWWSLGRLRGKRYTGIRGLIHRWELFMARRADAVFTYSTQGQEFFEAQGVPPQKVFVGVNVLDTNRKRQEIEKYSQSPLAEMETRAMNIAFIGTLTPEKNLEALIDAARILNQRHVNQFMLHIVGDGVHMKTLQEYVGLGSDSGVIFHGRVNNGTSRILSRCQVMVLPGLGGLAICEAMLNGLPVISGYADGTEMDLIDESNGYVLSHLTPSAIVEKVEYLFKNPEVRMAMGKASYDKITGPCSFDRYYDKFVAAVEYAIQEK